VHDIAIAHGFVDVSTLQDLEHRDRVCVARRGNRD